jgi:hypothetical protein
MSYKLGNWHPIFQLNSPDLNLDIINFSTVFKLALRHLSTTQPLLILHSQSNIKEVHNILITDKFIKV